MAYTPTNWEDSPSVNTPITAARLNNIENGIDSAHDALDGRLSEAELSATIAEHNPFAGLNIWEEFRVDGTGGRSWPAATYTGWVSGADARLGSAATKTTLGTDAAGNQIYAYTAGAPGAPHALVVGGTHPAEGVSMHAAMRYFTEFATSKDPVMVGQRAKMRLSWIPCLTPSGYLATRNNSDDVNVNRNFAFYWPYFAGVFAGQPDKKGPSAMSTAEAQAVKAFLDANPVTAVIDCHNDEAVPTISWLGGSAWSAGNQALGYGAQARFERAYGVSAGRYNGDTVAAAGWPMLSSWADHYLRNNKARPSGTGLLIESKNTLAGSVPWQVTTKEAMRIYCGLIHSFLEEWLANGQQAPVARDVTIVGQRLVRQPTVSIADGGTLLDTSTLKPIHLDLYSGAADTNDKRFFLDIPIPCPGILTVEGIVGFDNKTGSAPVDVQVEVGSGITPPGGGDVAGLLGGTTTLPAAGYGAVPITGRVAVTSVDGGALRRARLSARIIGAVPSTPPVILNATLIISFTPNSGPSVLPFVKLGELT